jgi:hypothetical protein
MENNSKVLIISSEELKKLGKELYDASIIICDNEVYKNRFVLSDDIVLDWVINHPGRIEEYIDNQDRLVEERRKSNTIEFADVSFEDLNFEVKIDITGLCASDKSNIALLIYDTLKLHGIKTNINDEDIEYQDVDMMRAKRGNIFNNLSKRSGVTIDTHTPD